MNFKHKLHACSCALLLIGFASVLITGSYTLPVSLGCLLTVFYYFWPEKIEARSLPVWASNLTALIVLTYLTFDSFRGSMDLIGNGIAFVILLLILKLISKKTARDWLQIYALSFVHIVAASNISDDLSFAMPFLMYLVFATWTLSLFNIQEQARTHLDKTSFEMNLNSKTFVSRSFFGFTALLSVFVLMFALVLFFIFPRVSFHNALRRAGATQNMAGFSDNITLGTIGNIKTNTTIAMRIELPAIELSKLNIEHLYWRATSLDRFDGRRWSQTFKSTQRVFIDFDKPIVKTGHTPTTPPFEYRVFLQNLSTPLLFGADRLIDVRWDKPMIERYLRQAFMIFKNEENQSFELMDQQRYLSDLTYRATSELSLPDEALLSNVSFLDLTAAPKPYLQLPPLSEQTQNILKSLPKKPSPFAQAKEIERFLSQNYAYTLDVQDIGQADPMDYFFSKKKKGHCEYFSTALVVALRFFGIPAREVMGFRGGEYNPYGHFLAVRQSDAHTWVEAFMGNQGWIRLDATPLDNTLRKPGLFFKSLSQSIDYLRLRWNKYIIDYDLQSQVNIVISLGKKFSFLKKKNVTPSEKDVPPSLWSRKISLPLRFVWPAVLSALLILGLWMKKQTSNPNLIRRIEDTFKPFGVVRKPEQTAKTFLTLAKEHLKTPIPYENLLAIFEKARYGGDFDPKMFEAELKQLKIFLKTKLS